jgi:Ca2+-transporting ATPase
MITGDHAATAAAVGDAVGIDRADVHSRVRPEAKSDIVAALRDDGEIVAMTGDGVNDAPALRAADIGVSMGERATEVARQAAGIVLTRDDLGAFVPALREGRRVFDNLRRFLHYALSGGFAEIVVMLAGPVVGFPVPLQAGQLLWMNLLTHGLPGVALGSEPAASDVLERPPRRPSEHLLDERTVRRVMVLGTALAVSALVAGVAARPLDLSWQSTVFVTLTLGQLAAALTLRPPGTPWGVNRMLPGSVGVNLVLIAAAVTWSPLRELLHTDALRPEGFLLCAAAAAIPALVGRWQSRHSGRTAAASAAS